MAREPEAIAALRRALGERLATFRQAVGLTQAELGAATSYDRSNIGHIEKGRARAGEQFWRIADQKCNAGGSLLSAYLELAAAKAEHEQRGRDQWLAAVRANAVELRGIPHHPVVNEPPMLDELRRALFVPPATAGTDALVSADVIRAHHLYQMADYDAAARLLPSLVSRANVSEGATMAAAYLAAAKLASKVGDTGLAWVTADRCLRLATEAEQPGLIGIAIYQIACALLGDGHIADAEHTAGYALEQLASLPSRVCSLDTRAARGALLLLLAIMAARRSDAKAAKQYLQNAAALAVQMGQHTNRLWTAFSPANVAIHELSVHVALGDSRTAIQLGGTIDIDLLPAALSGRRSQVHIELGWAAAGLGDDGVAVLHLLEAERVAQQAVSRNTMARTLLRELVARERKGATPGLRALATRAGVLSA
jgi:transcriptional regulator with XRE-family HTH domain